MPSAIFVRDGEFNFTSEVGKPPLTCIEWEWFAQLVTRVVGYSLKLAIITVCRIKVQGKSHRLRISAAPFVPAVFKARPAPLYGRRWNASLNRSYL